MPHFFGFHRPKASPSLNEKDSSLRNFFRSSSVSSSTSGPNSNMGHRQSNMQHFRRGPVGSSESPLVARDLGSEGHGYAQQSDDLWMPPPYSQAPPQVTAPVTDQPRSSGDSPYAFLKEFDTVFVVDDSSSMRGSRWREAEEAISAIAPVCTQYDSDGIDIYFLNHRNPYDSSHGGAYPNVTSSAAVREIFKSVQPCGATPFGNRLLQILKPYLKRVETMTAATDDSGVLRDPTLTVRPLNIIAITDGAFTDDAESVIVNAARRLDSDKCKAVPWQVGIQFFQIGNDAAARKHLEELDDELEDRVRNENIRDIVDTVPWKGQQGQSLSADGILKVVLGAVHKKYDKRNAFP